MEDLKKTTEPRDYENGRFEFMLKVDGFPVIGRKFSIKNFNRVSLRSYEIVSAIRRCKDIIDKDLKEKTQIYLSLRAPRVFDTVAQMKEHFTKFGGEGMMPGNGIVVLESDKDYYWNGFEAVQREQKFDNGELTRWDNKYGHSLKFEFSFLADGKEVCAIAWDGYYPLVIRNSVDLRNIRGRQDGEDLSHLTYEQYTMYKMVENRADLCPKIQREIQKACSEKEYTTEEYYGAVEYARKGYEKGVTYKNPWIETRSDKE